MQILIISQYFYPENFRINDFAFKMKKRGHEVTVLTGTPNYPGGKNFGDYKLFSHQIIRNISVYRVPLIPRGKSSELELGINYLSFLFSAMLFGPFLLRNNKPDIIFTVNYSPATVGVIGALFSRLKQAPLFLWVQDLWPDSLQATGAIQSKYVLRFINLMIRWIYNQSSIIFVQANSFKELIERSSNKHTVKYFPNWAEDTYEPTFDSNSYKLKPAFNKKKFTILFAGNIGVAQALDLVVKAADLSRDHSIQWVFVGDGREKDNLISAVREIRLEDHFTFLDRRPLEEMPLFFELADVLLVTLRKEPVFSLTIPGKIQSYLKSGKPILSSLDGEGAKVIEESGAGINVPSGDYVGLSKAAIKFSTLSKNELIEMGRLGKSYYNKVFNPSKLLDSFELEVKPFIKSR